MFLQEQKLPSRFEENALVQVSSWLTMPKELTLDFCQKLSKQIVNYLERFSLCKFVSYILCFIYVAYERILVSLLEILKHEGL